MKLPTILSLLALSASCAFAQVTPRPGPTVTTVPKYVMATFYSGEDKLRLQVSTDTFSWVPVGGIIYSDPAGDGIRDPSLIYVSGTYYCSYTAGSFGAVKYWKIIKSPDLVNWSLSGSFSSNALKTTGTITHTWVGNFYQESGTTYSLVNTSTDNTATLQPYLVTYTGAAPLVVASSTIMTGTNFPTQLLCQQLIKIGSVYNFWVKNDNLDYEEIWTSSNISSGYVGTGTGNFAGWGSGLEGGTWINTSGNNYTVTMDKYTGRGIYYATSTNSGTTWSSKTFSPQVNLPSSNPSVLIVTTPQQLTDVLGLMQRDTALAAGTPPVGSENGFNVMRWTGTGGQAGFGWAGLSGPDGAQIVSNLRFNDLSLNRIDTSKPGWWMSFGYPNGQTWLSFIDNSNNFTTPFTWTGTTGKFTATGPITAASGTFTTSFTVGVTGTAAPITGSYSGTGTIAITTLAALTPITQNISVPGCSSTNVPDITVSVSGSAPAGLVPMTPYVVATGTVQAMFFNANPVTTITSTLTLRATVNQH